MTRLHDRVKRLEAQLVASPTIDWEAERRERLRLIELLVSDETAMALYHDWLFTIQDARCGHRSMSACWPCTQVNPSVQQAYAHLQERLEMLASSPP